MSAREKSSGGGYSPEEEEGVEEDEEEELVVDLDETRLVGVAAWLWYSHEDREDPEQEAVKLNEMTNL